MTRSVVLSVVLVVEHILMILWLILLLLSVYASGILSNITLPRIIMENLFQVKGVTKPEATDEGF